jgi:ribosomal protein S18 acetylase RimI-like enzyme
MKILIISRQEEFMEQQQNTASVHIRRARVDDMPFIRSLAERFARFGSPAWRDRALMWKYHQQSVEDVGQSIDTDDLVLLAEDAQGTRLGFIWATHATDFFTQEPQGYVSDLAVSSQAEGKGVGRKLLEQAEEWARTRGYRILALDVFAANTLARAIYTHLGYAEETVKMVKEL